MTTPWTLTSDLGYRSTPDATRSLRQTTIRQGFSRPRLRQNGKEDVIALRLLRCQFRAENREAAVLLRPVSQGGLAAQPGARLGAAGGEPDARPAQVRAIRERRTRPGPMPTGGRSGSWSKHQSADE